MGRLTEQQIRWLQQLGALATDIKPTALQAGGVDAESSVAAERAPGGGGPVRVRLIPVDDNDLPPVQGLSLPTVEDPMVDVIDRDSGKTLQIPRSKVVPSKQYVDNGIDSLKARPDVLTLEVDSILFIYSSGATISVPMKSILFGSRPRAESFMRQRGMFYPADGSGKVTFDSSNTPNIVACAQWVDDELLRISEQRVEIAELVVTFAGAIAGLASASPSAHGVGLGRPPTSSNRGRGRRGGGTPAVGGKAGSPAVRAADSVPTGSGKVVEPPLQLGKIKADKQRAHSYAMSKANENAGTRKQLAKPDIAKRVADGTGDPNPRVDKILKAMNGKSPGASLLNQKYDRPAMQDAVRLRVQAELDAGRAKALPGGGKQIVLDMHEPTGWVVDGDLNGIPTNNLRIDISKDGQLHFFPVN